MRQSERHAAYAAALVRVSQRNLLHRCTCTRSQLTALPQNRERDPAAADDLHHPPRCPPPPVDAPTVPGEAWRLRVPQGLVAVDDRSLGAQSVDVAGTVGNFVLRRRDGCYAYQLAVVVDDAAQGVTDVVRGCDLLTSSARQVLLQQALGLPAVRYLHLPLAVDDRGLKLSKSADAPAMGREGPTARLVRVLEFLGQSPPPGCDRAGVHEVLEWATAHWRVEGFAGRATGALPRGIAAGESG